MNKIVLALSLLLAPLASFADAQALTGYQIRFYLEGGGAAPVSTFDFTAAQVQCGQAKSTAPSAVLNPTVVRWDDPADPARDCVWTDTGTGPLFAIPFSATNVYRGRLVAVNAAGQSPESAPSNPFSRPGLAPAAPVNVRLIRP